MRTTTMSDGLYGSLVAKLVDERKQVNASITQIERNQATNCQGIPTRNRREQEERLPALLRQQSGLTEFIETLNDATTH